MKLNYTTRFLRTYRKLSSAQKDQTNQAIRLFERNPMAPSLKNHQLKGQLKGVRSIKAGYDLRILFTEEDGHAVVFLIQVGAHDQVY